MHTLFEAQAARSPNAVAIEGDDIHLTYDALDRQANQVAHYLQGRGVGTEHLVAVCLDRSPTLVTAILGVLKAGAAYLPIDTSFPPARIAAILRDSQVRVLLTQPATAAALAGELPERIEPVADWSGFDALPDHPPAGTTRPDNLAYVIFTSGSTGRPKGVAVTHLGLANCAGAFASMFGTSPGDRVLHLSPPNFDGSLFELLTVLTTGATLCMTSADAVLPGENLLSTLREKRITIGLFVSSQLAALPHGELPELRVLVTGAEPTPAELCWRWMAEGRALWNTYGTTETTIVSTAFAVLPGEVLPAIVPIGRPLPNVEVYVLDEHGCPAEPGTPGELYIGGVGIARGYLDRPGLTADRFVPSPFPGSPGSRLYRTGDRGRLLSGGHLEFLGRFDHQIKVRGVRIEPGEVESALRSVSGVRDCVVVPEGGQETRRLTAYVVPSEGSRGDPADWRRALEALLPAPMIPSRFVPIAALPLGPTGKVDRKALLTPVAALGPHKDPALPRTRTEIEVARIWAEVLGVRGVGIHDDFFTLGGHSLAAARVIARVREKFRVQLSLRELLDGRTVANVARVVDTSLRGSDYQPLARRSGTGGGPIRLPLSFAQERMWFLTRHHPDRYVTIPLAIRLHGRIDRHALRSALANLIRRHEAFRTIFQVEDGIPLQEILPPESVPPTVVEIEAKGDGLDNVDSTIERFFREPFNLASETPLRVGLLQLGRRDHVLLIGLHHICGDRWSAGVLLDELQVLYNAFVRGELPALPELPVQYSDFVVWQEAEMQDAVAQERHLGYWLRQLAQLPTLALPTDHPRPPERTFRGGSLRFDLDAGTVRQLRTLAGEEGTTVFAALVAVFNIVLAQWSGQRDIAIGTLVRGRPRPELERLIGFFTNVLVLRTSLSGDPAFNALLGRVREVVLGAFDHEDLPFQHVVQALAPHRMEGRDPLFQVALIFHDLIDPSFALDGLQVKPQPIPIEPANYDIIMYVGDTPDGALWGNLDYSKDLVEIETAERLLQDFLSVLRAALADPTVSQSRLFAVCAGPVRAETLDPPQPTGSPGPAEPRTDVGGEDKDAGVTAALLQTWCDVLGVDSLPVREDVFAAGGHSLAALRVISRIEAAFGVRVPVRWLFEEPTISGLASRMSGLVRATEASGAAAKFKEAD